MKKGVFVFKLKPLFVVKKDKGCQDCITEEGQPRDK